jgi:hypothetical protein
VLSAPEDTPCSRVSITGGPGAACGSHVLDMTTFAASSLSVAGRLGRFHISTDPGFVKGSREGGIARASNANRTKNTPEWVGDDSFIGSLILLVFPKLRTNETHRKRAALWYGIIDFWFRQGWPDSAVANELQITKKQVHDTARRIEKAVAGFTTNGKPRNHRMGRPKRTEPRL